MMRLQLATADYIGARTQQQDAAAAQSLGDDIGAILILADGLGGHESGADASRIVIETFREAAQAGAFASSDKRRSALRDALEKANTRIAGGVDPAHGHRSMASTAVVAVVAEGQLSWISVGDSHLYVWRNGRMTKLNEDHSQAGLMVRSGQYKETDPEVLAVKSVLVSALTGRKLEIVDHPTQPYAVETGDVLLLASDGLNTLSESEIESIVGTFSSKDAHAMSTALLDAVKSRRADRQDNATVAVARITHVPKRAGAEPRGALSPPPHQITAPSVPQASEKPTELPRTADRTVDVSATVPAAPVPASPSAATVRATPPASENTVRLNSEPIPDAARHVATEMVKAEPEGARATTAALSSQAGDARRSLKPVFGVLMLVLAVALAALFVVKLMRPQLLDALFGSSPQPAGIEKTKTDPVRVKAKEPGAPKAAPQKQPDPKEAPKAKEPPKAETPPRQGAVPQPQPQDPGTRKEDLQPRTAPGPSVPPKDKGPVTPQTPREPIKDQPPVEGERSPPPGEAAPPATPAPGVPPRQGAVAPQQLRQPKRGPAPAAPGGLQTAPERARAPACDAFPDGTQRRFVSMRVCFRECDAITQPFSREQQQCRQWCAENCSQ